MSYQELADSVSALNVTNQTLVEAVLEHQGAPGFSFKTYDEFRAYSGTSTRVAVSGEGIAGMFSADLADTTSPDNGGTTIVTVKNVRFKREYTEEIQSSWFLAGVDPASSEGMQKALDATLAKNETILLVEGTVNLPDQVVGRSQVIMRGSGELTGPGGYRREVFNWDASGGRQSFDDMVPARHLKAFSVAANPVVVLTGSSTGGWQPDSVDVTSTFVAAMRDRISRYNPDKNIKFYNRAIGAQTYTQLDTIPTSFPDWYTIRTKAWLDYIKDVAPDVVFIIMGSNDSSGMNFDRLKSVTDKLKAFPKVPDIVFITQPSVCPDPHPAFAANGTKAGQEGRDYSAGLIRSWAKFHDHGLMDGNRMGGLVLDGRDLLDTIAKRMFTEVDLTLNNHNGAFLSGEEGHDFSLRVSFTGTLADIDAYFTAAQNPNNPVCVRVGAGTNGARGGDIIFIRKSATGKFTFNLFVKGSAPGNAYRTVNTDVDFPTGPFSLDIAKVGNTVTFSVAGKEETSFMQFPVITHGGLFTPYIGFYTTNSGPFTWLTYLNIGLPKKYLPALTSEQAWGKKNQFAVRQLPYGGNGINHFSSLGTAFIYYPLLNADVLTGIKASSGVYTPVVTPGVNVNSTTAPPVANQAMWTRQGDVVTVNGSYTFTPLATGNTLVDIDLPIPTNVTGSFDVAGVAGVGGVANMMGTVWGNDVAETARVQMNAPVNTIQTVRYTYSYRIR